MLMSGQRGTDGQDVQANSVVDSRHADTVFCLLGLAVKAVSLPCEFAVR